MKPNTRKLFLNYDPPYSTTITTTTTTKTNATSSPPSSSQKISQHNPPFNSSVALTVVSLLTVLFFIGFLSLYISRLCENSTSHHSRRRRYRGSPLDSLPLQSDPHDVSTSLKGLDPTTIRSLPVYSYHGNAKYQIDCAICLSEFEDKECVKALPYCQHVFHVECIDTWLVSHVSCPVCRGTRFFETKGGSALGVMQERSDQNVSQSSRVEISDTCSVMRRTSSCSSLEQVQQGAMLQRTLSF
ncbi:hypothetical protein PTKIN_Ptkin03bG0057200 [Pterospermum kingtungense]